MTYLDSLIRQARDEGTSDSVESSGDEKKQLVDSYGSVRIVKEASDKVLTYEVPTPHYKGEEKALLKSLLEIATSVVSPKQEFESEEEKRSNYFKMIIEIIENTPELKVPSTAKAFYASAVVKEMVGYGLIDDLIRDDKLEEIMILGPGKPVYLFHRKHEMIKSNVIYYDEKDIEGLIEKIARTIGRHIDIQTPLLDARLNDGSRVNATIPPVSPDGATLTIRKFKKDPLSIIDLMKNGTLDSELAAFLWVAVDGLGAKPANIIVAGGTSSGKTSTLNVLSSFIPYEDRIISIEDTAELSLPVQHWIRFESRPPSVEGSGEISMNDLLKNSLRMRPDRIIVGEIRGEEGYTLFNAMNTGHDGSLGTVHANSAKETIIRLTNPPINVPEVMMSSLDFIIMQNRINDRRKGIVRRVTEVAEVITEGTRSELQILYQWDAVRDRVYSLKMDSIYAQELAKYTGLSKDAIDAEIVGRAKFLEDLLQRNVHAADEVSKECHAFYEKNNARV